VQGNVFHFAAQLENESFEFLFRAKPISGAGIRVFEFVNSRF